MSAACSDGAAARATINELLERVAAAESAAATVAERGGASAGAREELLEAQVRELMAALEHQEDAMRELIDLRAKCAERERRPHADGDTDGAVTSHLPRFIPPGDLSSRGSSI